MAEYCTVSLGDGLFQSGGALLCQLTLLGVNKPEDSSEHWLEYVYEPYKIRITWTETTTGIRRNPKWQRIYTQGSDTS